ncbi:Tfp pilus assembly protein FimT/FimU [Sulfurovum sp.]|uniref:pilus assembly FimT family protein n=1 Tax=Sulfurovum sp. TaxID=1969726 RepID=UPI003564948B
MIKMKTHRSALSMLELVFVIVILGIVSSLGAEIIAKVYENYVVQRAQHRASMKTQLALNQITNRLRYAIPGTIVRRVGKTGTAETFDQALGGNQDDYTVLQWVAYDGDSFEAITSDANRQPGWSGFADLDASSATSIVTRGSNFTLTNAIQGFLGGTGTFAIYFPNDTVAHYGTGAAETITLGTAVSSINERYKLAWTSYALVVEANGDLRLYYDFAPDFAATIGNTSSLLIKNVTNFKFKGGGGTTRLKICVEENIGDTATIPSCKEKAVF